MLPQVGMPTHVLDGDKHEVAGLTPGHVLTATGAAAVAFAEAAAGGVLEAVAVIHYTGDDTNNRLISMGIECDFVLLLPRTSNSGNQSHMALCYAERSNLVYGVFINVSSSKVEHACMASADSYFQGLVAASPNVKLGSNGASVFGSNDSGLLYTIRGFKFA